MIPKEPHWNIGYDQKRDEREAEVWLNEGNGEMDADALNLIAVTGFNNCGDEFCLSQKTVGEDACACVRATFPSRDHYQLYLCLRSRYLEMLKLGLISAATKGTKETKYEKTDNAP